MILEAKQTTIAYRCPHCGEGVISAVGMFSLNADMVKLKCHCGKSALEAVYTNDGKVRLKVPCLICPSGHSYTVSKSLFFGRDIFLLPCPVSDIDIGFIGDLNRVKFELSRTELELLNILDEAGIDSFASLHEDKQEMFSDPQIAEIVMFVIRDLEAEGKIYCKCHPAPDKCSCKEHGGECDHHGDGECDCHGDGECHCGESCECHGHGDVAEHVYDAELTEDGILVTCPECGASRLIPTDGLLSAHAFLNCDALYLE